MMPNKVLGIIPARFASTRFPGKPLALIGDKPMIEWTYLHSKKSKLISELVVATDNDDIFKAVVSFGGKAVMTDPNHPTGTDRIIEVTSKYNEFDTIINIQGDEPGIEPELIDGVLELKLRNRDWQMATACVPFLETEDPKDPNKVKVVFDRNQRANYFSRSLIPNPLKKNPTFYRHLGIYAFEREFLLGYNSLPKSDWEESESLEQLRALQNGAGIGIFVAKTASLGVDSPQDLDIIVKDFKKKGLIL